MASPFTEEKPALKPKKKVLIITYYWPPSGGAGVQRWVKFAKYLPDFDIEPIILTVKNGTYPLIDETLLDEIAPDLNVFHAKALEPYHIFGAFTGKSSAQVSTPSSAFTNDGTFLKKLGIWVRANLFIPDARIGWKPFAFRKAKKIIADLNIDTIITTGPPNSTHLIGSKLKSKDPSINWIMDMRDPWSKIFYNEELPRTNLASQLDINLEKKCLKLANEVILVSESMLPIQKKIYDRDYLVINNGFDHEEFSGNTPPKKEDAFTIKYIGSMTEPAIPYNLFEALQSLDKESRKNLRIEFFGSINDRVIDIIKSQNLNDIVHFNEYLPHLEAKKEMRSADLLLLVIPNTHDNELIITGKIFDYIGAQKPILCIGPEHGDAAKLIKEFNLGINFEYDEVERLKSEIKKFLMFKNKVYSKWNTDLKNHPFSRYSLTKKLSQILYSFF